MCKYDNYINQTKHYSVCESNKAIMSTVENKYFIIGIQYEVSVMWYIIQLLCCNTPMNDI